MQSVSETVARALTRHIDQFFCLMGNGNAYFIDAVERLGVSPIPVRHETATVASADAYYRMTRKIAVATTTYGAGFTNSLTSLAESALAKMPLVLVVGAHPTSGPRPLDVDQVAAARALGVPTYTVGLHDVGAVTIQALADARDHSRPVVLAIPYDLSVEVVGERGEIIPALPPEAALPRENVTVLNSVAAELAAAERPLILAGRGAIAARADLRGLAETLGADVATTVPTQGFFDASNGRRPNYRDLGVCGGFAAPVAAQEIRAADVVLVVGAGLNQFTMAHGHAFGESARVIQIDLADGPTNSRVDLACRADAAAAVCAIREKLRLAEIGERAARTEPSSDEAQRRPGGDDVAPDGRLDPRRVMSIMNEVLPRERVVFTDGGHFMQWPLTYLRTTGPDSHITVGTQFQSIGLGFPSAAGVIAAAGDRLPVLVSGDGGGLMGIADAETFVRTARRGVVVFLNDAAYGAEVHQYARRGVSEAAMTLPEIDFAGIFRALGARGATVTSLDDLADFERWARNGAEGIYVLDCRITGDLRAGWIIEALEEARRAAPHVEKMLGHRTADDGAGSARLHEAGPRDAVLAD
ncbi:thiamine pyrophosphate-binding protein [Kocuria massiliensis]|uniref:thiamine pyrophosphate-binding protein n=1 Tax=Kocuria massiliensis TaxID=1926282 RepID=UPI0022B95A44|nr:thiamine pyrophosphate-binding protein [Kocuria massiliensis]